VTAKNKIRFGKNRFENWLQLHWFLAKISGFLEQKSAFSQKKSIRVFIFLRSRDLSPYSPKKIKEIKIKDLTQTQFRTSVHHNSHTNRFFNCAHFLSLEER